MGIACSPRLISDERLLLYSHVPRTTSLIFRLAGLMVALFSERWLSSNYKEVDDSSRTFSRNLDRRACGLSDVGSFALLLLSVKVCTDHLYSRYSSSGSRTGHPGPPTQLSIGCKSIPPLIGVPTITTVHASAVYLPVDDVHSREPNTASY